MGLRQEAFIWDATNGMISLGDLASGNVSSSYALDATANGTVVGGGVNSSGHG